jgi:hypothetical protein
MCGGTCFLWLSAGPGKQADSRIGAQPRRQEPLCGVDRKQLSLGVQKGPRVRGAHPARGWSRLHRRCRPRALHAGARAGQGKVGGGERRRAQRLCSWVGWRRGGLRQVECRWSSFAASGSPRVPGGEGDQRMRPGARHQRRAFDRPNSRRPQRLRRQRGGRRGCCVQTEHRRRSLDPTAGQTGLRSNAGPTTVRFRARGWSRPCAGARERRPRRIPRGARKQLSRCVLTRSPHRCAPPAPRSARLPQRASFSSLRASEGDLRRTLRRAQPGRAKPLCRRRTRIRSGHVLDHHKTLSSATELILEPDEPVRLA